MLDTIHYVSANIKTDLCHLWLQQFIKDQLNDNNFGIDLSENNTIQSFHGKYKFMLTRNQETHIVRIHVILGWENYMKLLWPGVHIEHGYKENLIHH